MHIRTIRGDDDERLAGIIRKNLKDHQLDIPGTAYFDPELSHLSTFYRDCPRRQYFVLADDDDVVWGGVGIAEFIGKNEYAELQKLYLDDSVKGQGLSYPLVDKVYEFAKAAGYEKLYLETHHNLATAMHVYERTGFTRLKEPVEGSQHGTMDAFYIRDLK